MEIIAFMVLLIITLVVLTLFFWKFDYLKAEPMGTKTQVLLTKEKRKEWREKILHDPNNLKIGKLYVLVGEFGDGSCHIINSALKLNYSVTAISGNEIWCTSKKEIENFLSYDNFKYKVFEKFRPQKHFMIIGKDLFVEVPHEFEATKKQSLGILNPDETILNKFQKEFNEALERTTEVNSKRLDSLSCRNPNIENRG
jgi:hypothetical protein